MAFPLIVACKQFRNLALCHPCHKDFASVPLIGRSGIGYEFR